MIECRRRACLLFEPAESIGISGRRERQRFQRDVAIKSRVVRSEHLAHPACANRRDDLIGSETGADSQGQVVVDYTGRTARRT